MGRAKEDLAKNITRTFQATHFSQELLSAPTGPYFQGGIDLLLATGSGPPEC